LLLQENAARIASIQTAPAAWKSGDFAEFTMTQPIAAAGDETADIFGQDGLMYEEHPVEDLQAGAADSATNTVKPFTLKEVRALDYGYAPGGASVQLALHAKHLADRYIVKQTFLAGKPRVSAAFVCSRLRTAKAPGKKALPAETWHAVLQAALQDSPIARLEDNQVVIKPIPAEESSKIRYHNALMTLCGVSLRDLSTAMQKAAAKRLPSRSRSRSPAEDRKPRGLE
jgi:hypothetical protein